MTFLPVLLALSGGAAAGPLDQAEEAWLRLVLRRDLELRVDSLERRSVAEGVDGAAAALKPQLVVSADAGTARGEGDRSVDALQGQAVLSQWIPTGGTLSGTLLGGTTRVADGRRDQRVDTAGAQIAFVQPLLRGFGDGSEVRYAWDQARLAVKGKDASSRATVHAVLQQARTAFWQQLARSRVVESRRQDSARTARLLDAARLKFSVGAGAELDTLQAGAEHLRAVSTLLSARADLRSGWRTLAGMADTDAVALPQPDSGALPPEEGAPLPDSATLLASALDRAPELAQASATLEKAEAEARYRRQARLPRLDLTGYAREDLVDPGLVLGAKAHLEWDLPAGLERSRYRQALLDARASEVRRAAARQELSRQIGRLLESVEAARAQLSVSVRLARAEARRLAATEAGWSLGKSSWTELVASRRDAAEAEATAWQSLASEKALEAELESRTGVGPERLGWSLE